MAATAEQIAQVRRMVAEPTTTTYSDATIKGMIEAHPLTDENGEEPRIPIVDMVHPVVVTAYQDPLDLVDNPDWLPTYDLYSAAADVWTEKAASVADNYNFTADGGNYSRSNVYEQYMKQARHYRSLRSITTVNYKSQPHRRLQGGVQ
jgi:hypothetical protein